MAASAAGSVRIGSTHLQKLHALGVQVMEEPIYVNAKQYKAIMRRRQQRAKAEAENKLIRNRRVCLLSPDGIVSQQCCTPCAVQSLAADLAARAYRLPAAVQPFLHESRHRHATKRERGAGGRFLNKPSSGGSAAASSPAASGSNPAEASHPEQEQQSQAATAAPAAVMAAAAPARAQAQAPRRVANGATVQIAVPGTSPFSSLAVQPRGTAAGQQGPQQSQQPVDGTSRAEPNAHGSTAAVAVR